MKKRILQTGLAMGVVLTLLFVTMPRGWICKADEYRVQRDWSGFTFITCPTISAIPSDPETFKAQSQLEAIIMAADPAYNKDAAIAAQSVARNMSKTEIHAWRSFDKINKYEFLERLISAEGHPNPSVVSTPQPTQPTQPTPSVTPTPTPTSTVPDPVTPVQYNTPTSYYFTSSGDQWQEVWYNTSSLMYLRGSVPADCDTSRTDCWQLSFDLDGETATVQGNGCTDWRGTSLDVSFNFDDDLINEVESYFIKGGDNVPVTFRYYAGNTLKKASVSGQPKLMLTYDGWLQLYVAR